MDWDALFNYLGTGGGLIVLLNWIAGLPLLRRKKALEKDDVSRQMAARDNETILWLYDQVQEFRSRMFRLEGLPLLGALPCSPRRVGLQAEVLPSKRQTASDGRERCPSPSQQYRQRRWHSGFRRTASVASSKAKSSPKRRTD